MSTETERDDWGPPSQRSAIERGCIQVWRVRLDTFEADEREAFETLVTAEERERADRFRFDEDRDRHLAGRGLVRSVLADALDAAPDSIPFDTGPHDKPMLDGAFSDEPSVEFNLGHADRWVVAAFRRREAVGIDVEPRSRTDGADGVARRVLTDREFRRWQEVPEGERAEFFMRIWTCKEALIKATGEGLYRAPETIRCRFDGDRIAGIDRLEEVSTDVEAGDATNWDVRQVELAEDATAAVAWSRTEAPVEIERVDGEALLRSMLERYR